MHYTLHRLLNGDQSVTDAYVEARKRWDSFYQADPNPDASSIAKFVTDEQFTFEARCGGGDRWHGQEVMVLAGFGRLYDQGDGLDEAKARILAEGFAASMASLEVKGLARRTAATYDL